MSNPGRTAIQARNGSWGTKMRNNILINDQSSSIEIYDTSIYRLDAMFNVANTWATRGYTSSQAYTETKGVLTPTPASLYIPSSDAIPPDGTEARRMQISARFVF